METQLEETFPIGRKTIINNGLDQRLQSFSKYIPSRPLKADSKVWENFLITESPLTMIKNVFYFTLKAPFVLKIFKFVS